MNDDDILPDDEDTNSRWQGEKETISESSRHEPPPWRVGEQLNDFVLEKLLGSGSSGFVYRVWDTRAKRHCALKILKHGLADDLLRNKLGFRRMMSIEHPNLLRVDRIYKVASHTALSMEEVKGRTFHGAVMEYKKIDPELAFRKLLQVMRDFATGLAVMHSHGYIHRDIKPENLMVDREGKGRVIDYGLVDAYELNHAWYGASGFLLGTPRYFAPEAIWSQRYLPAGDIFSLGLVILEALGSLQGSVDDPQSMLKRSRTDRQVDAERIDDAIDSVTESVPRIIRGVCREMLQRDPSERPTAMELARTGLPAAQSVFLPHGSPLVGRHRELKEITSWVDGIFDGEVGRLHLTGASGIGKSRLVENIVEYIEAKKWGQVFQARCRSREDQPLQAFDQICDAISNRYMRGDRERLELDVISKGDLERIFPVLSNILSSSMTLQPAGKMTQRLDALEAAARMSHQLRLVGPLFLIIDDTQWSDRDSLTVLDRLQTAAGKEGLGIITVSRDGEDAQRVPPTWTVHLEPLSLDESIDVLRHAAVRWSRPVDDVMLRSLAETTDGIPFRLRELADEFRPGGLLASGDSSAGASIDSFDRLWLKRAERLSDDAKSVLAYVVTAGGLVSIEQLGELTSLEDAVDVPVSELARQRLISDEATGGECIAIVHDRVADELIGTLDEEAIRKAHHAWASLLVRQNSPESLAARIAGHFFSAGEPFRAVSHAILAAEDAERLMAKSEAGRWYGKVVQYLDGAEKLTQMRNAARCYAEADLNVQAAEYFQNISRLVDVGQRAKYQALATTLLIRSGRLGQVRDQLCELAETYGFPKPSNPWRSRLSILSQGLRRAALGKDVLLSAIASATTSDVDQNRKGDIEEDRHQQRLRLCLSLVRPMSIFDGEYAERLALSGSLIAISHGTATEKVKAAVGEAVFNCYDAGHRRLAGESSLARLVPLVERLDCPRASAELWSGMAFSHALACRWDEVSTPVQRSVDLYRAVNDSNRFELAHTQWLDLWANWHLGQWQTMRRIGDAMFDDALHRNDLFQQLLATEGCGNGVWLSRDLVDAWRRVRKDNPKTNFEAKPSQIIDLFHWVAELQCLIYEGRFAEAWSCYQTLNHSLSRAPLSRLQIIRVTARMLGALVALHHVTTEGSEDWISRTQAITRQLRQESCDFAGVLANLYEGLLPCSFEHDPETEKAIVLLSQAREVSRNRRWRPYQLVAEDALAEIETGKSLGLLVEYMKEQQVTRPEFLRRLFTVSRHD